MEEDYTDRYFDILSKKIYKAILYFELSTWNTQSFSRLFETLQKYQTEYQKYIGK